MRVRRMTVVLPARLRHVAEHEARRIAYAAAEQLTDGSPEERQIEPTQQVAIESNGASGHALAASVAREFAQHRKGTR